MNVTVEGLLARLEQLEARIDQHSLLPGASADVLFLLVASLNVFFMQCGFGMLEAGSVTSRSTQAILLKNLLDACTSAFIWWVLGHGIAFDGTNGFIGTAGSDMSSFFLSGYGSGSDSGYHRVFWWFQWTFAAAAGTIVSGAVAERAHLLAYLTYTCILTAVIYPIIVHWCWSPAGWLSIKNSDAVLGGVIDFAGSGVVHLTGGTAGFFGALIIGPRHGRFEVVYDGSKPPRRGRPLQLPGHAPVLQALGTFILWLGWYGFNAGSQLRIATPGASEVVGRIVVNTTLSAAGSGLVSLAIATLGQWRRGTINYEVPAICNGILAGLVSITAGCATVHPWAALVIGMTGGLVYRGCSHCVLHKLKVDDPLDSSSVHGACGAWGVIGAAIFSIDSATQVAYPERNGGSGGLVSGHGDMLAAAVVQVLCIICWTGCFSTALFLTLKKFNVLRRPDSYGAAAMDEDLDATIHEGMPYIDPSAIASRASATATTADPVDASKA
mmetsp:Transcript_38271/g.120132  ORF Transcript_38271/g.120132 Transcript_38271/m.120132 type:complete len:497 (+) Transcript_38271:64-1554(+)